jgi:hypothetical protein
MKSQLIRSLTALALCASLHQAAAQGTAFTYQGQLTSGGNAANGSFDLTFGLFSVASGAGQDGATITNLAVGVTNGLFTVELDFGANYPGTARWLEISVRTNGGGAFTTLSPRQSLTPAPYAITAENVAPGGGVAGAYSNAVTFNNTGNSFTGDGSGLTDVDATTLCGMPCTNFWQLTGNAGTTPGVNFLGTTDNEQLEFKVNGVVAETLWPFASGNPSIAFGPNSFFYLYGQGGSFVGPGGGPGPSPYINVTYGDYCVIGGGYGNRIYALGADYSVIAGGNQNYLTATEAVISGGTLNSNAGAYATIPGGANNVVSAAGTYSFAAGYNAQAMNSGSFVWSDGSGTVTTSPAANSVTFRASGGYQLLSSTGTAGVQLAPGGGAWTSLSDRNAKRHFEPVNTRVVLDKLAALPVSTWNYKTQDPSVRHIGPTAQDFKAAFAVGESDTGITTVDEEGVALAAIKGLNEKLEQSVRAKDAEIQSLQQRLERLENMMNSAPSQP